MPYAYKYSAVFRPGSGNQDWMMSTDISHIEQADQQRFAQGMRITAMDRHHDSHVVVWRPGGGAQKWISGIDVPSFEILDSTYFSQGLRLEILDMDDEEVLAVWRAGSGGQFWRSKMTAAEFKSEDLARFNQGYRLRSIDIDNDGYIAAAWRPGTGAQRWWKGNGFEAFKSTDQAHASNGYRLELFDRRKDMWMGVWRLGSGPYYWYSGLSADEFKEKGEEHLSQGLRLQAVDLVRTWVESESEQGPYKMVVRINTSAVVDIKRVTYALNGPGYQENGSFATDQETFQYPRRQEPFGHWKIALTIEFTSSLPAGSDLNKTVSDEFDMDWTAGRTNFWYFSLELDPSIESSHYRIVEV